MPFLWYHWAIFGLMLMAAELLVPAFVLVWFGLGACLVAVFTILVPQTSFALQMGYWLISSLIFLALWFRLFKPARVKTLSGRSSAEAVGQTGLLIGDVAPFRKGQVRFQRPLVGADKWDCISDETIAIGQLVEVTGVEGSLLKVKSVEGKS